MLLQMTLFHSFLWLNNSPLCVGVCVHVCVYIKYYSFFTHSSVDGHFDCFYVLAVVDSAAVNIGMHVSFRVIVLSECMSRSGIAGLYGNSAFSFFEESAYCFPGGFTRLHCHQ